MKKWFFKEKEVDTAKLKNQLPEYTNSEMNHRIDDRIHVAEDREMYRMRLIDGLTLAQIASVQNRPMSTVRDHYYESLDVLFRK